VSEASLGPGWWQASDGKWYDPSLAPPGYMPSVPEGPQGPDRRRRRSNPTGVTIGLVMTPMGWYADPWNVSALRWWDGYQWTGFEWPMPGQGDPAPRAAAGAELALSTIPEDFASADGRQEVLPPELPARLHGAARSQGPWILIAFALILLITLIAVVGGRHGSQTIDWYAAVACLAAGCMILLAARLYGLSHLPYLEMDAEGIVVHRRGRNKRIAWNEIADVGLHVQTGEGVAFTVPTIYLRDGGTYKVQFLTEWGRSAKARQSVELILATRLAQVASIEPQPARGGGLDGPVTPVQRIRPDAQLWFPIVAARQAAIGKPSLRLRGVSANSWVVTVSTAGGTLLLAGVAASNQNALVAMGLLIASLALAIWCWGKYFRPLVLTDREARIPVGTFDTVYVPVPNIAAVGLRMRTSTPEGWMLTVLETSGAQTQLLGHLYGRPVPRARKPRRRIRAGRMSSEIPPRADPPGLGDTRPGRAALDIYTWVRTHQGPDGALAATWNRGSQSNPEQRGRMEWWSPDGLPMSA
jgi:hypothetical protein